MGERFLNNSKERGNTVIEEEEDYLILRRWTKTKTFNQLMKVLPAFMFGDSGSSCRIRIILKSMFDIEVINKQIGGVGDNTHATRKGKLKSHVYVLCKQKGQRKYNFLVQSSTAGLAMDCRVGLSWYFRCGCPISRPRPVLAFS